jgi:DUF1009 family protein
LEPHSLKTLGLISGSGLYPGYVLEGARKAGVTRVVAACFDGETDPAFAAKCDAAVWMRVGQLGKLVSSLKDAGVTHALMAGQIAPSNLFNLRPDMKALLLLAKLRTRNAESIFGAIADELTDAGITLLPATTFMDEHLALPGHWGGPKPTRQQLEDITYGFSIAKEVSRLDIGQTVVVKKGTVLAVEAFEGTNRAIQRGGELGRGGAVMVKVSKPGQDLRFDVPVIGEKTLETARAAGVNVIACEAGKTLLLNRPALIQLGSQHKLTLYAAGGTNS